MPTEKENQWAERRAEELLRSVCDWNSGLSATGMRNVRKAVAAELARLHRELDEAVESMERRGSAGMNANDVVLIRRLIDREIARHVADLNEWETPCDRCERAEAELRRLHELKNRLVDEMEAAA